MAIYLVTSNKGKLREFKEILGFKLENIDLDVDEIQAVEVEKVVEVFCKYCQYRSFQMND